MSNAYRLLIISLLIVAALVGCSGASTTPTPAATRSATATTVPAATDEATEQATEEATSTSEATVVVADTTATCTRLNLNTLTENDLMTTIPDFTARMVREFQEYRPYVSIQQFRREIGKYVDQAQVTEWEQYVFVPVDPNNSDAETLMQLPGVDEAAANALISGRPYADNQAFLDALGEQVDADQLAQASCYLAEGA